MLKLKKSLSILLAIMMLTLTCTVSFGVNAQEEQSAVDALASYISDNDDMVEFYLNSSNYTQVNNANNATTRNYRVYSTDDYDMYMKVVVLYQLYYAAAFEIMQQTDYMYSPSIYSSASSDFDAWNTYQLMSAIYDELQARGVNTTMANSVCLGSQGSTYNPTSSVNTNANAASTAVSYVGSIITTTDSQGYTDYCEENGVDYGMAYSLNFNMHLYQQEIDGTTYNIRYFAQDDVSLTVLLSADEIPSLVAVSSTSAAYLTITQAIDSAAFTKMITYPVDGGNIYIDTQDGEGTVVGADEGVTALDLPAYIDGVKIVAIDDEVFYNNTTLTSVVLPETITSIGENAFRNCSALETVVILAQEVEIGENAFRNCANVESVVISGDVGTIGKYAFAYCYNLQYLAITGSVQTIEYKAFALCTAVKNITLTNEIGYVSTTAFSTLNSLQTVYFAGSQAEFEALNLGFDAAVAVIYNHVCEDANQDGYCDVCTPTIDTQVEEEEEISLNFFEELIAKIQEYIEIILSVLKYNFHLDV